MWILKDYKEEKSTGHNIMIIKYYSEISGNMVCILSPNTVIPTTKMKADF